MQKDVGGIRETEAKQEQNRIAGLKSSEELKREQESIERTARQIEEARRTKQGGAKPKNLPAEQVRLKTSGSRFRSFEVSKGGAGKNLPKLDSRFGQRQQARTAPQAAPAPTANNLPPKTTTRARAWSEQIINPASREQKAQKSPRKAISEKIIIRAALVLVIILLSANIFLFWKWYGKKDQAPLPSPVQEDEVSVDEPVIEEPEPTVEEPEPEPEPEPLPELVIPPPLITVNSSTTVEIASSTDDVSALLGQALTKRIAPGAFQRILIKDIPENKLYGAQDFFQNFTVDMPAEFLTQIEPDFTLFIYGQKQGNRLVLIAKTTNAPAIVQTMHSWELKLETDTKPIFDLLGKQGPALVSYFKQANYRGKTVRYQTFSKNDLGICYAIVDDYFIFASSWEGLLRTIDKLIEL